MTYTSLGTERTDDDNDDDGDDDDNVGGGGGGGNGWGVDDDDDVDNLQWGTKVLRHFRKMTPFCMGDIPIPFPCLPQPLPPKINVEFWSLKSLFTSDNIDSGGRGIYGG